MYIHACMIVRGVYVYPDFLYGYMVKVLSCMDFEEPSVSNSTTRGITGLYKRDDLNGPRFQSQRDTNHVAIQLRGTSDAALWMYPSLGDGCNPWTSRLCTSLSN